MFVVRLSIALSLSLLLAGPAEAADRVLMFTKSAGFEHSVVKRGPADELGLAERLVVQIGRDNGFEVDVTKDGTKINAANLKNYRALFFYTQGELTVAGKDGQPPMKPEDRQAILDFVANGGGFVGTHCGGADTFHGWTEGDRKPFLEMVGGEFIGHGAQQSSRIEVVDPSFPALAGWPASLELTEEWYAYRGFQPNIHVLAMLHTDGMKDEKRKLYDRPSYPIAWCSEHGKGRVFYTGLGHREDVWNNELHQKMVAGACLWVLGRTSGDASPNLKTLFGGVDSGLQRINPPAGK